MISLFDGGFMSFAKLAEEKIREAIAKGEFDNLPGRGRPVDLSAYFATPEELRLGYSVLKSGGFIPEEVSLLQEVEVLKQRLARSVDEEERSRLKKELDDRTLKLNLLIDRRRSKQRRKR